MLQQTHHTQNTGIGSFAGSSPDYELAPIGLGSFQDHAKKLAEFGRNGDIYVVHAAEGETVIPMEVLNANPKVRELLFGQMREMGLDPQEFVIGNELNSINPVTGLPEFFFKSIFRSVKKAAKKAVKVAKKLAPIILPIAASAFGIPFLGPAFGAGTFGAAFLGGGIGTLAAGGSMKDAIKSGLVSGGTSLAFSGIGSLFNKGTSFGDAVTANLTGRTPIYGFDTLGNKTLLGHKMAASPWAVGSSKGAEASAAASKAQWDQILGKGGAKQDVLGGMTGEFFGTPTTGSQGYVPLDTMPVKLTPDSWTVPVSLAETLTPFEEAARLNLPFDERGYYIGLDGQHIYPDATITGQPMGTGNLQQALGTRVVDEPEVAKRAGFFDTASDLLFGKAPSDRTLHQAAADLVRSNPTLYGPATDRGAARAMEYVTKDLSPGPIRKYGPSVALGLGGTYLAGGFDPQEGDETTVADLAGVVPRGPSGAELIEQDPSQYLVQDIDPTQFTPEGTPLIPTTFPALLAARGGMAEFPRRDLLVEGPGTTRSDDIPAMLSDGEFVMNARAVRGADPTGRRNRYAGAQNLYNMMRNFEMKA